MEGQRATGGAKETHSTAATTVCARTQHIEDVDAVGPQVGQPAERHVREGDVRLVGPSTSNYIKQHTAAVRKAAFVCWKERRKR
jgi:hypothetical protein